MSRKHVPAAQPVQPGLRERVLALAEGAKPFLPVNDKEFTQCSHAISNLANNTAGNPLLLPSELLPPLF